tara:strand:+ start:92 stop:361 length:270 start_codon:yes stop_codon:yes gene_type:complete
MVDDVWTRDEIQSPCVKICLIHPLERICTGCYRTIEEIVSWSSITDMDRKSIILELPKRKLKLKKRRGGRSARLELIKGNPNLKLDLKF